MKRLISLLLILVLMTAAFSACGSGVADDPVANIKITPSADKYRSYYQVWIGSFHDSDGDGIGDIPGLIEKLDYINDGDPDGGDDLGCDGIWLSPMMPSSTYHKYNVEDYYDIDVQFGTLDDFDKLIKECHDRGIVVIIDLVLNHSGAAHEFFQNACNELRKGKEDGYARYYNFSKEYDSTYQYQVSGTDYYYQGDFWDQMPDWNLSYDGTRKYFEDVTKFWLDRGVDGFRLDAVKYFNDSHTDGTEFLKWFEDMARGYKSDVYMVGEDWDDAYNVYETYKSGVDSLFNFKFAGIGGEFMVAGSGFMEDYVKKLKKYEDKINERNPDAIDAFFLTNHDMVRIANNIEEDTNKFDAALYMLAPGNSFTYYGEEIGMEALDTNSDAFYRSAMIWDNDALPDINANGVNSVIANPLGGVKQQLAEEDSLLNTYRRLIRIRQQNPEIPRGKITDTVSFDDEYCAGYILEYNGSRVMIIHNGDEKSKELTIDAFTAPELRGWVMCGSDELKAADSTQVTLSGTTLTVSPRTSVVLKETK